MNGRTFLDTNVLVYLFDDDEEAKQDVSRRVLSDPAPVFVVSTQVLAEFYVVVTRKLARPLDPEQARSALGALAELHVVGADVALVQAAVETSIQQRLSLWDAMIVEAAASACCERILTEDLSHDSVIRGVTIENPFRSRL